MVDIVDLTDAIVETFQAIPEVVAALTNQDAGNIFGFIDLDPRANSEEAMIYSMPMGTVMVSWQESVYSEERSLQLWSHRYKVYARGAEDQSALKLLTLISNGIPTGFNRCWRYLQVLPGTLPVQIEGMTRDRHPERMDTFFMVAEFRESGDAQVGL